MLPAILWPLFSPAIKRGEGAARRLRVSAGGTLGRCYWGEASGYRCQLLLR